MSVYLPELEEMASCKLSSAIAVLLTLLIAGSQAKPHSLSIQPLVETLIHNEEHLGKAFNKRNIALRQDCTFANYPSECNFTLLSGNISYIAATNPSQLTLDHLNTLNNAYNQICVSKCIDPVTYYYQSCLPLNKNQEDYIVRYIEQGICGKNGNDYCQVEYLRNYKDTDVRFIEKLVNACPFSSGTGINCTSANSTCLQLVADFASKMGCCTVPYLGDGVKSCSGANPDASCQSAVTSTDPTSATSPSNPTDPTNPTGPTNSTGPTSAAGAIAIGVFPLLLALISAMF